MEQSRLIIAIVISFAIFFAWSIFFAPKSPDHQTTVIEEMPAQIQKQPQEADQQTAPAVSESVESPIQPNTADQQHNARSFSIDTNLYRITLSEKGAAVIGMTLKKYQETIDKDSPHKELINQEMTGGTVLTTLGNGGDASLANAVFTTDVNAAEINAEDHPVDVLFTYQLPSGMVIEKSYRFRPDTYLIDVQVRLLNKEAGSISGQLFLGLRDYFPEGKQRFGFVGPSGLVNNKLKQVALKKIAEDNRLDGKIKWVALEKLYFMSSLVCNEPIEGAMVLSTSGKIIENQLVVNYDQIPSGGSQSYQFSLFMGPKNWSLLKSYNNELDRAINFGWVDFLAKPCLWFLNFIHRFVPNYGIAIIILTILTRLIFWPLTHKSYKSMSDMRKLQPLMKEIKEKYKDDKARINQETMALYRTYKINPMSGCLPMVIQLPVFFALYRMLYTAIELRHAPFFGWIQDLSAPERLFHFSMKIPFMDPPTGIPVLTIIMGVTMLIQQKMTPTPGDPSQAKMMMIMPLVFMVIFINFSSGLVLYWLVGNIVSITQQYLTQKKLA